MHLLKLIKKKGALLKMNSKRILSFSAGLLVATTICGAVYFAESDFNNEKKTDGKKEEVSKEMTIEEMESELLSQGYVVHTEEEWQQLEDQAAQALEQNNAEEQKKEEAEKVVYRTFLTVSQGMTSIDVADMLAKAKIIEDKKAFRAEVEKRGVEKYLRPGTFELDSDMSVDEIISTLFKQ